MQENKEISALFTLIDDPDENIFTSVSDRIVNYGRGIIPNLENLWENSPCEEVQERIELIIHRLHYSDLLHDLREWRDSAYHDLLFGALLVAKFQYPDLQTTPVILEIEKMRRNVWLELNSFLTPLEHANVISSIVYNYYNLKGVERSYANPDDYFLHKVVQSKKGNSVSNGILYLILADLLDIPVKAINIPRQFVLAFFNSDYDPAIHKGNPKHYIQFYVDATNGQAFTQKDVENYLGRNEFESYPYYFKPMNNLQIIQMLIQELINCFNAPHVKYKKQELKDLCELLEH